ncbi:UNVERIFIED_CONTAM: hypothetical protein K2H54_068146 [Gekko kuhli]
MELSEVDLGGEAPGAGAGSSEPEPGRRGRVSSSTGSVAEEEDEGDAAAAESRRASRASSLVSGLLVELYSVGRPRHRDSVDSSTEASAGSDAFPGGRGSSAESRFLQELQRRPNKRHQRTYLAQKGSSTSSAKKTERGRSSAKRKTGQSGYRHSSGFAGKLETPPASRRRVSDLELMGYSALRKRQGWT